MSELTGGKISANGTVTGGTINVPSVVLKGGALSLASIPLYDGSMEITPDDYAQVLTTDGKKVVGNIVVNPIPSNYGKISWNGSYLLVE